MGDFLEEVRAEPDLKPRVAQLEEENEHLRRILNLVQQPEKPVVPRWAKPTKKRHKGRATAFTLFSDLHLDEIVRPEEINGINAYNRVIAEMRVKAWAEKVIELADREEAAGTKFDGLTVFLLGDTLTGWIHEELMAVGTEAPPTASLVYWAPVLAAAFKLLADRFENVIVVCEAGNHGRATHRQWAKKAVETNYDWVIAHMVANLLASDDRIEFVNTLSFETVTTIYDTNILSFHGNRGVGGGNGQSGIWPPLFRAQGKMRQRWSAMGVPIDVIVLGHFHTATSAANWGWILNGSGKGPDEWSIGMGFPPSPAEHLFGVVTPEHGITDVKHVFVADRKAEGW